MVLGNVRIESHRLQDTRTMEDECMSDSEHKDNFYDSLEREKQNTGKNHKDKKYIDGELYRNTIEAVESRKYEKCPIGDAHFKDWSRKFSVEINSDGEKILMSNPDKLAERRRKQEEQRKKKKKIESGEDEILGEENRKDPCRRKNDKKLPVLKYEDYFVEIRKCHKKAGHNMENTWQLVTDQWYFVTKKTVQLFCEACKDCRTAPKHSKRKLSSSSQSKDPKRPRSCTETCASSFSPASTTTSSSMLDDMSPSYESSPSYSPNIPKVELITSGEGMDPRGTLLCQTSSHSPPPSQSVTSDIPSDLQNLDLCPMEEVPDSFPIQTGSSGQYTTSQGDNFPLTGHDIAVCRPLHLDLLDSSFVQSMRTLPYVPTCESLRLDSQECASFSQPQINQSEIVRVPLTRSQSLQFENYGNQTLETSDSTSRSASHLYGSRLNLDFCSSQNTKACEETQEPCYISDAPNTVSASLAATATTTTTSITTLAQDQPFGTGDYSGQKSKESAILEFCRSLFSCAAPTGIEQSSVFNNQQGIGDFPNTEQTSMETPRLVSAFTNHHYPGPTCIPHLDASGQTQQTLICQQNTYDLRADNRRAESGSSRSFMADLADPTSSQCDSELLQSTDQTGISLKESKTFGESEDVCSMFADPRFHMTSDIPSQVDDDSVCLEDIDPQCRMQADFIHLDSTQESDASFLEINPDLQGPNPRSTQTQDWKETASSTPSQAGRLAIDPGQQIRLFGEIQAALTADEDGDIPLHLAVVHEHLPLVQKFIQLMKIARRSVDRFNKDKQTPLHLAVKLNFIPGVKALLNAGADVNFVDKTGCTSLHLAVKHQLPECLKILVDGSRMEADFNTRNFEGLTPLHTAVELRNMGLMAYVLDHRADINMMDGKSGRTPLFHAAENNQEDVVEFLLKRAANPDVLNYAGSTALMAAQARNYNIVTKMLSRASDWNEEDRSGSSSPASEISVYIPDQANQKISGIWKHTVPLRNAATFNPSTGTFVGNASSNSVEVSLASQSPKKTKLIEGVHQAGSKPGKAAKTGGAGMKGSESPTTSNTSGAISGATATISQSAKTVLNMSNATSTTMSQPSFTISQTTAGSRSPIDSGKIESAKSKSDSVNRSGKKGPPLYETLQNSEFNNSENLRAIDELAKKNPQVAFQFQKLLEAKQRGIMAAGINAANQEKQNHNGMKESEWDTAATQPDQKSRPAAAGSPSSSMSHRSSQPSGTSQSVEMSVSPRISHSPRMSHSPGMVNSPRTSNSPGGAPSPRASHSPGVTQPSGISQSSGTAQITNNLIPSTVTSRQESNVPRVVSAPSQVIGKVSHVVEKLPQQPERIISTGMVVEHPEYGLVFRPFGPGQIQRLNQTGSVPRTPASQEGKATEASEQEKDKPPEVTASSENSGTKETELIAEPPVSAKPADTGKTKESADSPKTIIPPATETVSSHPVTEKLLNSKPKMTTIPKSRPTDGNSRSQDSVSKPETSNAVKSIANSAIAAKLRQRVLNSPQVDAAKALANAPIHPTTTAKSSGAVMTAPERVPKLPQFGSRPSNMTNSSPTASPGQISTHPEGVSKILEHLSKPIEPSRPGVDLTKVKQEKTKKPEKRKKKDANGKNIEVKKKSVMLNKDNKKDWNEDSGSSEPMDT